jgi:hypothetical protein
MIAAAAFPKLAADKRNEVRDFGAGFGENGTLRKAMQQRKPN